MNWKVIIDPSVNKRLKKIPKNDAERILKAAIEFGNDPFVGDIDKMEGADDSWRRRIGDYRIFYWLNTKNKVVYVFDLKRRTTTTY